LATAPGTANLMSRNGFCNRACSRVGLPLESVGRFAGNHQDPGRKSHHSEFDEALTGPHEVIDSFGGPLRLRASMTCRLCSKSPCSFRYASWTSHPVPFLLDEPVVTEGLRILLPGDPHDLGHLGFEPLESTWSDLQSAHAVPNGSGSSSLRHRERCLVGRAGK